MIGGPRTDGVPWWVIVFIVVVLAAGIAATAWMGTCEVLPIR